MRQRLRARHVLLALPCVALALGFVANLLWVVPQPQEPDGRGYFAWQQSLLFDGDLDPADQIRGWNTIGFPYLRLPGRTEPTLVDKYSIGWSLTVLPVMTPLSAVARRVGWTPVAATGREPVFGYAVWVIGGVLGVATVAMSYDWLNAWFEPDLSALAVVTAFFGSAAFAYFWRNPFMAHGASAFWLTAALWTVGRYARRGGTAWLLSGGLAAGMLVLCRTLDVVLLLPAATLLAMQVRSGRPWRLLVDAASAGLLAAGVLCLQGLLYRHLYGAFFYNAYAESGERFQWTFRNVPDFLANTNHGVLLWHPVLGLAVVGLIASVFDRRGPRTVAAAAGIAVLLTVAAYACWWCWWLGESYGARWTADLMPLWALGLAAWARRIGGNERRLGVSGMCYAPLVLITVLTLLLQATGHLPTFEW